MVRPSTVPFHVATLNVRRLASNDRLIELQTALRDVKVDVLVLTELRWRGIGALDLADSDYRFYHAGPADNNDTSGTGFLISSRLQQQVQGFERVSGRVSFIDIRLGRKTLRIYAVYAPSTTGNDDHDDAAYEVFLNNLAQTLLLNRSLTSSQSADYTQPASEMHQIVLGDFNAKVGMQQPYERSIGKFSYSNQNERGHMLIDFCKDLQLQVFNSFFKKLIARKWTWRSPNGRTKNEIDFVLAPHNSIFTKDVCVVASFNFYSDHHLLRATLHFNHPARKRRLQPNYCHAEPQPRGPTFLNKNIYQFAINQLRDQMPLPTASLDV
uniref:Endonuclease/exonuclease/phosphatase domain-containing protein n=1 Tax=Plectus sambesii TaxID=2011161 RepID=A0A914VTP1_9BILA